MAHRVLLINPWIHDFTAYDLWMKPLGLLYIASTLSHAGYEVNLIDCLLRDGFPPKLRSFGTSQFSSQEIKKPIIFKNYPGRFKRYGMSPDELKEKLQQIKLPPLLICVTSIMTYWYTGVFEAIKIVKEFFPSTPLVLGGIYATLCYDHAKVNSGAGYIVKGAGEIEVLKIADKLSGTHRNYHTVENWLEKESSPAYNLYTGLKYVSIVTSKGCPFNCTYCASKFLNPGFSQREPDTVVNEIETFVTEYKIKNVAFYDDALLVNPDRHIIPILQSLIKKDLNVNFHSPNGLHPGLINDLLADLLVNSGFKTFRLSFEGISSRVQKASKNKVNKKQLEQAINCFRKALGHKENLKNLNNPALDISIYILLGLPGQPVEEVIETIKFLNGIGVAIRLSEYSPIPETVEFKTAVKLCPDVLTEPLIHNKSVFPAISMGIDYKTLQEIKDLVNQQNKSLI